MSSIMDLIKQDLTLRGIYTCPSIAKGSRCSIEDPITICKGCIHEKGAHLLAVIGINLLTASINDDYDFDLTTEIENQISLVQAGIEPVIKEPKSFQF